MGTEPSHCLSWQGQGDTKCGGGLECFSLSPKLSIILSRTSQRIITTIKRSLPAILECLLYARHKLPYVFNPHNSPKKCILLLSHYTDGETEAQWAKVIAYGHPVGKW